MVGVQEEESMEDNGERCNCSLVPARRQVTKAGSSSLPPVLHRIASNLTDEYNR